MTKVLNQVKFIFNGGKILKKANALTNLRDKMVIYLYKDKNGNMILVNSIYIIRYHSCKNIFNSKFVKVNPFLKKNNFKLNLTRLGRLYNQHYRRSFSTLNLSSDRVLNKKCGELHLS